jgi:hypothetical protein
VNLAKITSQRLSVPDQCRQFDPAPRAVAVPGENAAALDLSLCISLVEFASRRSAAGQKVT